MTRAVRAGFDGKATPPATVAHASQFFLRYTEPPNNTMFRANQSDRIHDVAIPMRSANNGLQNNQNRNFSALLVSSLLYSTFLDSALLNLYPTSTLPLPLPVPRPHSYSSLLNPPRPYSALLYATLLYSTLLYPTLFSSFLSYAPLLCSTSTTSLL